MEAIEVFADIGCPFTHVGLRLFVAERERLGRDEPTLIVRAWPLEWVNGEPMDPAAVGDKITDLRSQVAPDLFGGYAPAAFPVSTLPALELAAVAYERDARTGEAVSLALRDSLFESGDDPGSPAVLRALADRFQITSWSHGAALVSEDYEAGRARGVRGSPHFFYRDDDIFCPSLDIARAGDHFDIHVDTNRLRGFFANVFA